LLRTPPADSLVLAILQLLAALLELTTAFQAETALQRLKDMASTETIVKALGALPESDGKRALLLCVQSTTLCAHPNGPSLETQLHLCYQSLAGAPNAETAAQQLPTLEAMANHPGAQDPDALARVALACLRMEARLALGHQPSLSATLEGIAPLLRGHGSPLAK
jgi:hypothetical protein